VTQELIVQNGPERGGVANAIANVTTVRRLILRAVQNPNRHTLGMAVRVVLAEIA
jgi:hypothetical protein